MTLVKNSAVEAMAEAAPQPVHEQVYHALRERVLFGDLAPGEAVTIQGLAQSLPAGMTPVREAIRRLISEGALQFLGNRRVIVPQLTLADLEQLVFVRKSIEPELTRRAVSAIEPALINRLHGLDTALDHAISRGDVPAYLAQNYRFHATLYACAGAPVLAEMADRLWLRFGPSLRVVCGRFGTQNLPDRHKDLLAALARADTEAAATAMVQDIEQGMEQIAAVLADSP
ncbi:GntR family transcriptional regulator [Arenibacterium halophilum]